MGRSIFFLVHPIRCFSTPYVHRSRSSRWRFGLSRFIDCSINSAEDRRISKSKLDELVLQYSLLTRGATRTFFLFAAQLFLIIEYQPPIKRVIGCASLIWLIICIISSHSGDSDGAVSVLYLYNAWTVLVLHTEYYSSSKGSKPSKLNVDLLLYSTYFIPGGVYIERVLRINVRLNSAILRSSIRSTSSAHSQLPRMYDRYIPDLQNTSEQIIRTLNKRSEAIRCAFEGFVSPLMVH